MEWLSNPQAWISLLTLTILEIVLGVDNIIFISILASKLPKDQQAKARQLGLALALITRVLLLLSISWLAKLTTPLFEIPFLPTVPNVAHSADHGGHGVATPNPPGVISGRDLILLLGGLFLIAKATHEIHNKLEGPEAHEGHGNLPKVISFNSVIIQIILLDVVFSLDSVITAVGLATQVGIMITAVIIAVGVMLVFAGPLSRFVDQHPTVKMLALAFLVLIGFNLVADGFGQHIEKGYIYFAMAFSVAVEMLNLKMKKKSTPVKLHQGIR